MEEEGKPRLAVAYLCYILPPSERTGNRAHSSALETQTPTGCFSEVSYASDKK